MAYLRRTNHRFSHRFSLALVITSMCPFFVGPSLITPSVSMNRDNNDKVTNFRGTTLVWELSFRESLERMLGALLADAEVTLKLSESVGS